MAPHVAYLTENCFKLMPKKDLRLDVVLPVDWSVRLAKVIGETLGYSELKQSTLTRNLSKHVNNEVDITGVRYGNYLGLNQSLMYLYQHVFFSEKAVSTNVKQMVALKLVEDIQYCSTGYHNRVNEALAACCLPSSIDEFLQVIRSNIVMGIATASGGVHQAPAYFELAKNLGYGVPSFNESDVHMEGGNQRQIEDAFRLQYQPDKLFINLVDMIQNVLRESFGYHGLTEASAPYDQGDCESLLGYLQTALELDEPLHVEEYFITTIDSACVDLNWSKINQKLMECLVQRGYFDFDNQYVSYLLGLFDLNVRGQYSALLNQYMSEFEKSFRTQYGYRGAVESYTEIEETRLLEGVKYLIMPDGSPDGFLSRTEDGTLVDLNWPRIKEACFLLLKEQAHLSFESLEEFLHPRHAVNWDGIDVPNFFEMLVGLLSRLEHVDNFELISTYIHYKKQHTINFYERGEMGGLLKQLLLTCRANVDLTNRIKDSFLRQYVQTHPESIFMPTPFMSIPMNSDAFYFSWCCFSVMEPARKQALLRVEWGNHFRAELLKQGSTEMLMQVCSEIVTYPPSKIKEIIYPQRGEFSFVDTVMTKYPQAAPSLMRAMTRGLSFQEQIDIYQRVLLNREHRIQPAMVQKIHWAMQLVKLGQKGEQLARHQVASRAAKDLHVALMNKFCIYMGSQQEKGDLLRFKTESTGLLAAARQGVLATHRGCKDILAQALLCLTGIGLLYIGIKKATDYYRFGLFEPLTNTDSVNMINAIQSDLNTLCAVTK